MTFADFQNSLLNKEPDPAITGLLLALWYDGKGDWEKAHHIAQDIARPDGSWVHAFLHRREGDLSNASYWYHQAGKKMPTTTLDEEWENIVKTLMH